MKIMKIANKINIYGFLQTFLNMKFISLIRK